MHGGIGGRGWRWGDDRRIESIGVMLVTGTTGICKDGVERMRGENGEERETRLTGKKGHTMDEGKEWTQS